MLSAMAALVSTYSLKRSRLVDTVFRFSSASRPPSAGPHTSSALAETSSRGALMPMTPYSLSLISAFFLLLSCCGVSGLVRPRGLVTPIGPALLRKQKQQTRHERAQTRGGVGSAPRYFI